ncbi:MAG: universal stress protein, partial [Burkholderiaceae bacterium]
MNQAEDKILACVDLSGYAEHVADCAAWAAKRLQAPLEFLHVIERHPALDGTQDHSGTLGANANETLLKNLSDEDAARTRAEREHAREFLNTLRVRAEEAGAQSVDTRQRHGDLEETLGEQQHGTSLFVLGRRGASAQNEKRALGLHVEWTVRSLQRPILAVTEQFKTPERVLIAFDGSAVTRKGIEMVAVSPLFKGLPVHVVMAGQTGRDQRKPLAWACQTL